MDPQQPPGSQPSLPPVAPEPQAVPPAPTATTPPAAPAAAPPPAQGWSTTDAAAAPPGWKSDEAVGPAPGVAFAGYGARLVAYIIDWAIIGLAVGILWVIIAVALANGDSGFVTTTLAGATILIWLLYFPYFWHRNGVTPGMMPFGIRVVRDRDGGPIGWGSAFLRLIGYAIDTIVFGLPIGFLWVFFDKRRRAWHDLIGGTVVIKG